MTGERGGTVTANYLAGRAAVATIEVALTDSICGHTAKRTITVDVRPRS